ncbi:MAG: alanine racemase [Symbiobacteriaceae bacterium]|nr:alanine racemase [Symbiobacteriaceae bacterium]
MPEQHEVYNSYMEIDLKGIKDNLAKILRHLDGKLELIPVLKGNAYGFGEVGMAEILYRQLGFPLLACAQTYEAQLIRDAGMDVDLFILGGIPFNNIPAVVRHDFITPAFHVDYLVKLNEEAVKQGKPTRVKIKIDTGMNRIGCKPGKELAAVLDTLAQCPQVKLIGVFTHFAESEAEDKSFTLKQLEEFRKGLAQIKERGYDLPYIHAFNSAATVWLPDITDFTHVRNGNLIFGFDKNIEPENTLGLSMIFAWRAFITHVKDVTVGETIGYNRFFVVEHPMKVATISIGYADGFPRNMALYANSDVLVHGQRAKVIGIAMDQMLIDITHLPEVKLNDIVTLIGSDGKEHITTEEIGERINANILSLTALISARVPRIYVE